ncbi:MAG: glycoside hydrolase family 127 protein [Lachnospiraceae bacterium]|nr:glycoside hydrolase family 127 protein [Lachnospiraceae bacterium]
MKTVRMKSSQLKGMTGTLAQNITKNWLIGLRQTNPAILDMFMERDRLPYRSLLPWSGEFAGKYITGAYYIYRMTLDESLRSYVLNFIEELLSTQADNGYMGCFSKDCQLTGAYSQNPEKSGETWDGWNHYHIMFGLLLWYDETKDARYLQAVEKAASLFIKTFFNPETGAKRLVSIGFAEMNLAPIHVFVLLYHLTGKQEYLDFALEIETDIADEQAGNYIQHALNGLEYYQCPKPRWESIHVILGILELYHATGRDYYRQVVEQIFWSILKTDVHNTGGFSTTEQAVGTPFKKGPIETCCVIAYDALGVDIFKLTKDVRVIDFLERAHYNACMGFWSPTGRWSTYDTPMNGIRVANIQDIVFQSRPGSPELNCCSVNAARGIGMYGEWAVMQDEDVLYINGYEDADFETEDGISIKITGGYPAKNSVTVTAKGYTGKLALRIPEWSEKTQINVNGNTAAPEACSYFVIDCDGETKAELVFDFTTRYLKGAEDFDGCTSIFRGPILFGTDVSLAGGYDLENLPVLNKEEISAAAAEICGEKICIPLACGVTLCDFYHLGETGSQYVSWLKLN